MRQVRALVYGHYLLKRLTALQVPELFTMG